MFKRFRKNKISNYFAYALGEIILIVVGVLIAVGLNNWNENRKEKTVRNGIFTVVHNDLAQDTLQVNNIIDFYEGKADQFKLFATDTLTLAEIEACQCDNLIVSRRLFSLHTRGYQQLIHYKNDSQAANDTLIANIIDFYTKATELVQSQNERIDEDIYNTLNDWKSSKAWFSQYLLHHVEGEDLLYFGASTDYRNKVAMHYILLYENYLPTLRSFNARAHQLLQALNQRIAE